MGMNVLCELDWTVHTASDRSEAFHPKRQEALSMQVSGGISPALYPTPILSPRTTIFLEILWPELGQISSRSSSEEDTLERCLMCATWEEGTVSAAGGQTRVDCLRLGVNCDLFTR